MDTLIWSIFWASAAVFITMVCIMLFLRAVKSVRKLLVPYGFFGVIAALMILGVILIVLTVQKDVEGISRVFLLLTGAAAAGMSIFAILHNLVTAMFIKFFKFSKNFDEPVFFLLAVIACPLGFLAGAVGTIVVAVNK